MRPNLDAPEPSRPHRVYVALTNHCNRGCPWCSTCSSPAGRTFIDLDAFRAALPRDKVFQLQLEGGEPTVHPRLWAFVEEAWSRPACDRLVLCTNGTLLPRDRAGLERYLERLGGPLTIKLSVNHYLLERDPGLLRLCEDMLGSMRSLGGDRQLVINVRLRRGYDSDDEAVRTAVERAGLLPHANVFFLQAYGYGKRYPGWQPPHLVWDRFTLVNPDGAVFGTDLVARSEAMRALP